MGSVASGPRVEAIDRALLLLTALAGAGPEGASLASLAEETGIPKPTAYRALSTMRLRGYADQSESTGHYRLGLAAISLAQQLDTPRDLALALHPALVALSRSAQELVHLGVLSGGHVVYIDKVEPERAIRVWSAVGQLVPVASSALGRALLAARGVPLSHLGGYLDIPERREVTLDRLAEAVLSARRLGYAVERGENEPGVACVGTAVLRGSHAVAAISITAPEDRMTDRRQAELAEMLHAVLTPLLPAGLSLLTPDPSAQAD
ncbi:MAG: IclR family transcriptional regulator [Propioniciclava sp.]|uniref:IclR family transcriptional regulator n=1 Tax=Propioniciclava sp. TaxID=2038686 RepID=UPI0039E25F77